MLLDGSDVSFRLVPNAVLDHRPKLVLEEDGTRKGARSCRRAGVNERIFEEGRIGGDWKKGRGEGISQ